MVLRACSSLSLHHVRDLKINSSDQIVDYRKAGNGGTNRHFSWCYFETSTDSLLGPYRYRRSILQHLPCLRPNRCGYQMFSPCFVAAVTAFQLHYLRLASERQYFITDLCGIERFCYLFLFAFLINMSNSISIA